MSTGDEDGNALSRWSRRKLEARGAKPDDKDAGAPDPAAPPRAAEAGPEGLSEEEALEAFHKAEPELAETIGKIDIDQLTFEDDFTIFMKAAVPDFIRRKALTRLWNSNPVLAVLDGLNDYDLDYTEGASQAASAPVAARGEGNSGRPAGRKRTAAAQRPAAPASRTTRPGGEGSGDDTRDSDNMDNIDDTGDVGDGDIAEKG